MPYNNKHTSCVHLSVDEFCVLLFFCVSKSTVVLQHGCVCVQSYKRILTELLIINAEFPLVFFLVFFLNRSFVLCVESLST